MGTLIGTQAIYYRPCCPFVTASNGDIYAFALCDNGHITPAEEGIYIYKSTDGGQSFSQVLFINEADIIITTTAKSVMQVEAAIDSAGYVHLVTFSSAFWYSPGRNVAYAKFNTANDTCSTWENVVSLSSDPDEDPQYSYPTISLFLDSSDKPHLLYLYSVVNGTLRYTNKTGTSWLAAETVSTGSYSRHPQGIIVSGSIVNALYDYMPSSNYPTTRVRNGTWGTAQSWANSAYISSQKLLIADSNGVVYRYATDLGTNLFENDSSILSGSVGVISSTVVDSNTRVLIYFDDADDQIKYICKKGIMPWTNPVILPGISGSFWTDFQFYNKNEDTKVYFVRAVSMGGGDYAYYFESFTPDSALRSSAHAFINGGGHTLDPDEDIANTGTATWINELGSTTPLCSKLNDDSDTTYVWCSGTFIGSYFEVGLENPSGVPTGSHVLSWRGYRKSGSRTVTVKAELRKSNTLIASDEQILSGTVYEFNKALTPAEITQIGGDYTDLRVRFITTDISH